MGILIITPTHAYATRRLTEEAAALGIEAVCADVASLHASKFAVDIASFDALWVRQAYPYYDEVINLAKKFKEQEKVVIDGCITEYGIEDNKFVLTTKLVNHAVVMPETRQLSDVPIGQFAYPFIVKWVYGFGGRHVYLVEDAHRLNQILKSYPAEELMYQEYVDADFEYNVITVGYKSLPLIVKYKIHPFKKVTDLERFEVIYSEAAGTVASLAEKGSKILGRELAKSDILQKDGRFYLLEVNRQPGLRPFEEATKLNVAKIFLEYIVAKVNHKS